VRKEESVIRECEQSILKKLQDTLKELQSKKMPVRIRLSNGLEIEDQKAVKNCTFPHDISFENYITHIDVIF
jgi:predicted DNA binding CopG/RHH family protein